MKTTKDYTLFFGGADVLSNWHPSPFTYRGHQFNCVEQFMMFSKAKIFGDEECAKKVLATQDPKKQKALGREVKNYDEAVWSAKRLSIVTVGCREKFVQNPALLQALLATKDTVLVEASPYDRVWGIGLGKDDPRSLDPEKWLGSNLLGKALMEVRKILAPAAEFQPDKPTEQGPSIDDLTHDQRAALIVFRAKNGHSWKQKLLEGWQRAAYPGALQQIRNQFGPEWLNKLKHVPEYRLQVTLKTSDGREGAYAVSLNSSSHPKDGNLVWSPGEPDALAHAESVSIECFDGTELKACSVIDGDVWCELEDGDRIDDLLDQVLKGEPLQAAVETMADTGPRPTM